LDTFLLDYRRILTDNFQKFRIEGRGEYWTCGQEHDPRNWNWKPWQHLERLCRKLGLDDFAVRDIVKEHLGRKLDCECQVLYDERELLRKRLKGNLALILRAWRSDWLIETGTAEPFLTEMRNGIWDFGVR